MIETVYSLPDAPRLAFLADLHGRPHQHIISSLHQHQPELIAIVGDIVYGSFPVNDLSPLITQHYILPFLEACSSIAPTYLSLGNHEVFLDAEDLKTVAATGAVVLDNSWVKQDGLVIGGLTSAYVLDYRRFVAELDERERAGVRYPMKAIQSRREADRHTPDTAWLANFCAASADTYHLLLCHHPEYWPMIEHYPFDLCLSAHAHGGQWRLFGHGIWSPGQYWWPRYTRGLYDDRMVVSAGLSNTARIPRLFNPTEVVYIEPE